MENKADYNPYYIFKDTDPNAMGEKVPAYNMFYTSGFLRDINRPQMLKVFKVALSGFLTRNGVFPQDNLYYSDYSSVENVVQGRKTESATKYPAASDISLCRHAAAFDNNTAAWHSTSVRDDVIVCHYYNPEISNYSGGNGSDELIYFLYDIIAPNGNYSEYMPPKPEGSQVSPKVFNRPRYTIIEANKIAAIGRLRGLDTDVHYYTHNWYYFNLQGFDLRCRFKTPSSDETVSGYINNVSNATFSDEHHHTTDAVKPPEAGASSDRDDSRPPNMRDAHDHFMRDIASSSEICKQDVMDTRLPEEDIIANRPVNSEIVLLPSGAAVGIFTNPVTSVTQVTSVIDFNGGISHIDKLALAVNKRLTDEDKILDGGVQ